MSKYVLFSDDVHINKRNFASLYNYLEEAKISTEFCKEGKHLWNRYGHYEDVEDLGIIIDTLKQKDLQSLRGTTHKCCGSSINIFDICKAEILTRVMAEEESWYSICIPRDDEFIFNKLYHQNKEILLQNMAATIKMCDIYTNELPCFKKFGFAVVFSGSQMYQKLLANILRYTKVRVFLIESFQTGTEYYFEEKYDHIANNSDSKWKTVLNAINLPQNVEERHKTYARATNKIIKAKNKNVNQPSTPLPVRIKKILKSKETFLLSCQVQNDFSLIENKNTPVNAQMLYRDIICKFLKGTNYNLVIKTHPWERNKNNLKSSFTYNLLKEYIKTLPKAHKKRIAVIEDANINLLIDECSGFITLNSQSSIEACFYGGLRPFTLGTPFYGGYGFTNDFGNIDDMVRAIKAKSCDFSLSIDDFNLFMEWYTKMLQYHLVCVHKSGVEKLRQKLKEPDIIAVL